MISSNIHCSLYIGQHIVVNTQNPQSNYIHSNIEKKDKDRTIRVLFTSKGFEIVACDVGILV